MECCCEYTRTMYLWHLMRIYATLYLKEGKGRSDLSESLCPKSRGLDNTVLLVTCSTVTRFYMNMKHWKTIIMTSFYFFLFFSIDSFLSDLSQQIQTKLSRLKRSLLDGKVNNRTFSKSQTYQNVMNNHWTALFCYIWRIAIRWYSFDGRTKPRMRVILTYTLGRCACV